MTIAEPGPAPVDTRGERVRFGADLYNLVSDFYLREAELLDAGAFGAWLELLHPAVTYRIPVRETVDGDPAESFSDAAYIIEADRDALAARVSLWLESTHAWAEVPHSRTRRYVTNVRVRDAGDGQVLARSSLLFLRSRWDIASQELVPCERVDELECGDGDVKLRSRVVLLDKVVSDAAHLATLL